MSDNHSLIPWGPGTPDPNQVYLVPLSLVQVPDLRVTSTFTDDQREELIESIKNEGQKDPIKCIWQDNRLVLADGLNRLLALHSLGATHVKTLVTEGNIKDVQIANIITARTRGRENPGQTADVIADLIDNEKMDPELVMRKLGLSKQTFRRLLAISRLPAEVKDHLKYGRIGVMSCYHLAQLQDRAQIIQIAENGIKYGFTEEIYKAAVMQALNPDIPPEATKYTFEPTGQATPVLITCQSCNNPIQDRIFPINCCSSCYELIGQILQRYWQTVQQPQASGT